MTGETSKNVSFSDLVKVQFLDDIEEDRHSEYNSQYVREQRILVRAEKKLERDLATLFLEIPLLHLSNKRNGLCIST